MPNNRAKSDQCLDQYSWSAPLLIQVEMCHPVLSYQIDIGAARTGEEYIMSPHRLQARKIDSHVHNTIADFVTMICKVKNANTQSPCRYSCMFSVRRVTSEAYAKADASVNEPTIRFRPNISTSSSIR